MTESASDNVTALHTAADESVPRGSGRRRLGWVLALVALVGVAGAAWWVGASTQSPDQAASRAREPVASWVTAPVEYRVLSSTIVTRGDAGPETSTNVAVPSSVDGTPVLTQAAVTVGNAINEGDRVAEVSGRPVFVLQGDVAIYRTLRPGMTGDDVTALQESLVRLGYPIDATETGVFGRSTKVAVAAFYAAASYEPVPASATFPADLAVAERAVTDAETAVSAAQTALDNANEGPPESEVAAADEAIAAAGRALEAAEANVITDVDLARTAVDVAKASRTEIHNTVGVTVDEWNAANVAVSVAEIALSDAIRDTKDAVEAAEAAVDIAVLARKELDTVAETSDLQAAVDAATSARDDATNAVTEVQRVNGPTVPQGEIVFVTETPARVLTAVASLDPSSTPQDAPTDAMMSLASGNLIVTGSVRPDQVGLVSTGLAVELLDELTSTTYPATVTSISDTSVTGPDGQLGHPLTITATAPLPDNLAGTNLRITLTAASTNTEQLVVPLAAVTSTAGGATRVSVLDPTTGQPVDVEVTAGLSADGFVAVEPLTRGQLTTDSKVIVGQ